MKKFKLTVLILTMLTAFSVSVFATEEKNYVKDGLNPSLTKEINNKDNINLKEKKDDIPLNFDENITNNFKEKNTVYGLIPDPFKSVCAIKTILYDDDNKNNIRPIKSMLFHEVNEFMKKPSNDIKDDNIIENDDNQKIKEYYKNLKKLYKLKFNEKDNAILEKTIYIHSNADGFLKQVPFLKVKYNSKIFYLLKNNFKAGYLTEFDLKNGDLYLNENYEDYDKKNVKWKKIEKDKQKKFFEKNDIAKIIDNILKTKEIKPRTNNDYVFEEKTNNNPKSKLAKWVCDNSSIAAKNGYQKYNLPKKYRLIYDENGNMIEKQLFEYVGFLIDSPQMKIAKILFNPAKEKLYDDSKYVEGYLTESDLNDSEEIYILNPKYSKTTDLIANKWVKVKSNAQGIPQPQINLNFPANQNFIINEDEKDDSISENQNIIIDKKEDMDVSSNLNNNYKMKTIENELKSLNNFNPSNQNNTPNMQRK